MTVDDRHPLAELVRDWTDAWNACDEDALLSLLHPEFRMHRMKGDVIDRSGMRDALRRQGYGVAMKLFPRQLFVRGDQFAVAARIEYRHVEDDELLGATDDGGMAGELREGLVVLAAPKPTSAEALAEGGLTEADLTFEWAPPATSGDDRQADPTTQWGG